MREHHAAALARLPQPFARREVPTVGLAETCVKHALASRFITSPARGLYAVRTAWESASPWDRHRALIDTAVRLIPDAVVSHTSQAVLLGLPHPSHPPPLVTMTVLDDVRTSSKNTWCRLHRGSTPPEHIVIRHGVPGFVTARVVIDSGREVHPRDALAIADGALRAGLTTFDELLDMRRHQRRWPGVLATNDVLVNVDPRRETWLESVSSWAMHRRDVPLWTPQVNVFTPDGEFRGRPDGLWEDLALAGEADGLGKYLIAGANEDAVHQALREERIRQSGMEALGLRFIRWTTREAIDGSEIDTRFRRMAALARPDKVTAIFRCSCCGHPLPECRVSESLSAWRRLLAKEFTRKIW